MKTHFLFIVCFFATASHAQTAIIAHKSHSGNSASFFTDPSSNFGAIGIDIEKYTTERFTPLNDSTIIREVTNYNQQVILVDTLPNNEKYSAILFQYKYQDSIRKKELEENYKREQDQEQEEQFRKQQLESQEHLNEPVPAKKKKKSYLLFLFGITGGGMLLMRLFSKSRIIKPSLLNIMKTHFLFIVCFFATASHAQTAIIAHKSHSGTVADFFSDPSTNFGIPSARLVQVIRLNDTTSIEVYEEYDGYYQYDTVYNNVNYSNYHLNIDSITQVPYYHKVEYINFSRSSKTVRPIPPGHQQAENKELEPANFQAEPQPKISPKKKKKRSALLFIFLITGGGLSVFRVINRIFTPQIAS